MQDDRHTEQPYSADDEPAWWPYAHEFPYWHVWRGIGGLLYARRLMSSPPWVVRVPGPNPEALREAIKDIERAKALAIKEGAPGRLQLNARYSPP